MIRLEHLIHSPQVSVLRSDHHPDSIHDDPQEEICQNYAIHFVEAGSFKLTTQKNSWTLSPGTVFTSRPGAVHRYSHDEQKPSDVCTSIIFSPQFMEETNNREHLLPSTVPNVLPPTNRLAFLKLRLTKLPSLADALILDDWACDLISAVRNDRSSKHNLYRARQLSWYSERVEAVRQVLETRYAESHSLASLAKEVGMSSFQFTRVFSDLSGLPPHQYLLRVRMKRAAQMLLDGASVTDACFDVGFSNLSHFIRSFKKRFGVVPSLSRVHSKRLQM
jgi:AraC family transcriptional regulator